MTLAQNTKLAENIWMDSVRSNYKLGVKRHFSKNYYLAE